MQLTNLFDENDGSRAVSPVIGVILMVAITVILAAVIGTFVLGLGDSVESAPQATFNFDYDDSSKEVVLTHRGGDSINTNNTELRVNSTAIADANTNSSNEINIESSIDDTFADATDGDFRAGDSVKITPNNSPPDSLAGGEIVLVTTNGERQNIIAEYDIPE